MCALGHLCTRGYLLNNVIIHTFTLTKEKKILIIDCSHEKLKLNSTYARGRVYEYCICLYALHMHCMSALYFSMRRYSFPYFNFVGFQQEPASQPDPSTCAKDELPIPFIMFLAAHGCDTIHLEQWQSECNTIKENMLCKVAQEERSTLSNFLHASSHMLNN
jgi:hypothetical protein